jgi:predicted amidophosphoribosyltransferase
MRVALIDDVLTTGSTVLAAAQALVAAGVREVHVWAVARVTRD